MRNPDRIAMVMNVLKAIWDTRPDIRFNQLMHNLQVEYATEKNAYFRNAWEKEEFFGRISFTPIRNVDLFYVEDEEFLDFLQKKLDEYEK